MVETPTLDPVAADMVADLDRHIIELDRRGWLQLTATAETLICQIYHCAKVPLPAARLSQAEACVEQGTTTQH